MQHSSILLIRLCFSKRPDPLGCTQLNLNRAVFSLNQRSRTNLAIETTADWTSGRCCVEPLRPPQLLLTADTIYVPRREAANRCWISSGDRSSLWVAIVQACSNGSAILPARSP